MRVTCGTIIVSNGRMLITHPTNHPFDFWSFPKGLVDKNDESYLHTAIRETKEETGIDLMSDDYKFAKELPMVKYQNGKKKIKLFVIETNLDYNDIELHCESMVYQRNRDPFPECDRYKWVSFNHAMFLLHEAQKRALYFY